MNSQRFVVAFLAFAVVLSFSPVVRASFIPTTGSHNYTNTANWVDGIVDGVITNTQTGNITLTFSDDVVLDSGLYFAYRSPVNYTLGFKSANGAQTVTLGGDVYIRTEAPAAQTTPLSIGTGLTGSGTFFLDLGGDRTFGEDGISSSWAYIRIPINAKLIDRSGKNYPVNFTGRVDWSLANENTFTGPMVVTSRGSARIGVQLTEKGTVATTNIVVCYPGRLALNNFSRADGWEKAGVMVSNRVPNTARISLTDTMFSLLGGPGQAPETNSITESVGLTTLSEHVQILSMYAYTNGAVNGTVDTKSGHVRLEFASLARSPCASARFAGGDAYKKGDPGEIGGNGLYSSSITVSNPSNLGIVNGIVPWAIVGEYGSGRGLKLAKYDGADGFQALVDGEDNQVGFTGATTESNVRITNATTLTADQSVNSLACEVSGSSTILGPTGKTVTLGSGTLLIAEKSSVLWLTQTLESNFDFAGRPAYIFCGVNRSAVEMKGSLSNIGAEGIAIVGNRVGTAKDLSTLRFTTLQTWEAPTYIRDIELRFWGAVSPTNSAMNVSAEGVLTFGSNLDVVMKSLSGAGNVYGTPNGWPEFKGTYTIGDQTDTTFSGSIYSGWSVPNGNGNLIKRGTGTWMVDGSNFCTGMTTVAAGTLVVNGSFANNAQMLVESGATLGGVGEVAALTVPDGATVSPGSTEHAVGTLSVIGGIALQPGGRLVCEVTNPFGEPGSGWDLLSGTGTLTVSATAGAPFTLEVRSLTPAGEVGAVEGLALGSYSWKIASGASVTGFSTGTISVDHSAFMTDKPVHFSVSTDGDAGSGLYLNCEVGADGSVIVIR